MRKQLLFAGVLLLFTIVWLAGPAYGQTVKVGSFLKPAASGSQVVPHGLGETPKALILWTNARTAETWSSGIIFAIGFTDQNLTSRAVSIASDQIIASSTDRGMRTVALSILNARVAPSAEATFTSRDAAELHAQLDVQNKTQNRDSFVTALPLEAQI